VCGPLRKGGEDIMRRGRKKGREKEWKDSEEKGG